MLDMQHGNKAFCGASLGPGGMGRPGNNGICMEKSGNGIPGAQEGSIM